MRSVPDVEAAGVLQQGRGEVAWEGAPPLDPGDERPVTAGYGTSTELPKIMGMRIVRGRWFNEGENAIVINEALARRDFPGEYPIGRRMPTFGPVVGVY